MAFHTKMLQKSSLLHLPLSRGVMLGLRYMFWAFFALVTYLMLIELPPKHGGWPHWDKLQHLLVFMMLTSSAFLAYGKRKVLSIVLLILYGAIIEWLQGQLTMTRMPSLGDWLADVAGVLLTFLLTLWIFKRITKKVKMDAR